MKFLIGFYLAGGLAMMLVRTKSILREIDASEDQGFIAGSRAIVKNVLGWPLYLVMMIMDEPEDTPATVDRDDTTGPRKGKVIDRDDDDDLDGD